MEDYKFLFKVVLVGNAGVGKTCLVRRFTQGMFPPGQGATIGVDFMIKTVEIEGEKIKVMICTLYDARLLHIHVFYVTVTNLGYCWPGKVSQHNSELLQICACFDISLRCV